MATTGSFTADLFDKAYGAFVFDNSTNGLETVRDVISGGTGNDQGSVSLLFRSLTGAAGAKRYLFSQRAPVSSNEFAVYRANGTASNARSAGSARRSVQGVESGRVFSP